MSNTYLGKYGYTIPKSELQDSDVYALKHELMKPYQSCNINGANTVEYHISWMEANFIFLATLV